MLGGDIDDDALLGSIRGGLRRSKRDDLRLWFADPDGVTSPVLRECPGA